MTIKIGSEKQISWANSIKEELLTTITNKLDTDRINKAYQSEDDFMKRVQFFYSPSLTKGVKGFKETGIKAKIKARDEELATMLEDFFNNFSIIDCLNNIEHAAFFIDHRGISDLGQYFRLFTDAAIYNILVKLGVEPAFKDERGFDHFTYADYTSNKYAMIYEKM